MDNTIKAASSTRYPNTNGDGNFVSLQGTRTGAAYVLPEFEALAYLGRVFAANMGSVTTPLTFLTTAANRPDAWIRVPSGTTIIPVQANIVLETSTGTATEIDVRIASNDIGNGTSSAATVGPQSTRTDAPVTSLCTARQLATADTTAETTPISVYRRTFGPVSDTTTPGGLQRGIDATREIMGFPICVGPATWEIFIAATTTQATGFVIMQWAEIPSTWLV